MIFAINCKSVHQLNLNKNLKVCGQKPKVIIKKCICINFTMKYECIRAYIILSNVISKLLVTIFDFLKMISIFICAYRFTNNADRVARILWV